MLQNRASNEEMMQGTVEILFVCVCVYCVISIKFLFGSVFQLSDKNKKNQTVVVFSILKLPYFYENFHTYRAIETGPATDFYFYFI